MSAWCIQSQFAQHRWCIAVAQLLARQTFKTNAFSNKWFYSHFMIKLTSADWHTVCCSFATHCICMIPMTKTECHQTPRHSMWNKHLAIHNLQKLPCPQDKYYRPSQSGEVFVLSVLKADWWDSANGVHPWRMTYILASKAQGRGASPIRHLAS